MPLISLAEQTLSCSQETGLMLEIMNMWFILCKDMYHIKNFSK